MTYDIFIVWGESVVSGQEPQKYSFKTEAERMAFRLGVSQTVGWNAYNDFFNEGDAKAFIEQELCS